MIAQKWLDMIRKTDTGVRDAKKDMQKLLEKDIVNSCLSYLTLSRIFHYRQNTGAFRDARGHLYRFGSTGAPDIIVVIQGRYVGIECKRPGQKQNEAQKNFQKKLSDAGGYYFLVHNVEELRKEIERLKSISVMILKI